MKTLTDIQAELNCEIAASAFVSRIKGHPFQTPEEGQPIIAETKWNGVIRGKYNLHRWKYDAKHWWERKQIVREGNDNIPWRQVVKWAAST